MIRSRLVTSSLVLLVSAPVLSACELVGGGDAPLFDVDLLVVPEPGQVNNTQALCEGGTVSHDLANEIVAAENASIEDDKALLLALLDAEPSTSAAITTYQATVDGKTLVVTAVQSGDAVSYTATLDGEDYLAGTSNHDGAEGTLSLSSGELSVAWSTDEDGAIRVARTQGARSTAMVLRSESVKLAVTDADDSGTVVAWTAAAGVAIENGGTPGCWQGAEFCEATCSQELTDLATAE
jgi:hypothetical protein